MADTAAAAQFTVLAPEEAAIDGADARLVDLYAYPDDLTTYRVRGNMITSVDGGATADGKTGALGAAGDRTVFEQMRYAADVILVGASTVRTENYSGAQVPLAQRSARQARGQAEVPPIAVITRSGRLDPDTLFFTRTEVAPLVLTCTAAHADTRARLGGVAEVIDASGSSAEDVDPATALQALADRGLRRVLTEGGPGILGLLIAHDLLDELCLTVAPFLVGGAAPRIASGPGEVLTRMRPAHVLTDDDGYLYLRYTR
ncbi:Pyrimidine reductase, riboflavin biosynthesis [Mycolicibacterium rutilum]|uniref:Pyrimidine reductase, riboflavin biosynthesis n=1 Tax=Mycolicibacterium rutilum TaxID=370526 RepID=A0A1H6L5H9_MYCRU|nr:pyrimidine reductase family protein [Mycolicibacterium rutilum]SEH83558.1 Pyrimidine reductase, riboflavin biosynthesis [Mycolicibacterium rutilum]